MKLSRKLHLWLSVPFGILITLICFSGAMLIFEKEITRSLRSDVYYNSDHEGRSPLPLAEIVKAAEEYAGDDVKATGIVVDADPERTCQVNLSRPARSAVFVDRYTGRVTGTNERMPFFAAMMKMHRVMFDPAGAHGDGPLIGKNVVSISTIVLIIAIITGIIIWWPKMRANPAKGFSIYFRKGVRKFMKSSHVAGGVYVALLLLVMALTGLTWSYKWYRTAFYTALGTGLPETAGTKTGHHNRQKPKEIDFDAWQTALDRLTAKNPDATQYTLTATDATATFAGYGNPRKADTYRIMPDGSLEAKKLYEDETEAIRLRGWIYSIHIGMFGGITTRILWFIAALSGALLPISGYYIWIRHLRRKKEKKAEKHHGHKH